MIGIDPPCNSESATPGSASSRGTSHAKVAVDYGPEADVRDNSAPATAIDVDDRWFTLDEGAQALFLRGRFDSASGQEWYSVTLSVGDCIFQREVIAASGSPEIAVVDAAGVE